MDINKLKHHADFNLNTQAFGMLRCGPWTTNELAEYDRISRTGSLNGEDLARKLLLAVARKLTQSEEIDAVCGGAALTEGEADQVTRSELDDFSDQFIARRLRTISNQSDEDEEKAIKSGCERLPKAIIAHTDAQRIQMERILGQARSSILGGSAFEAARKALEDVSIEAQVRKHGLADTLKEHMRRLNIGETPIDRARKDLLGASALDAAFRTVKASDNLGESIAALRAMEEIAKQPKPIDVPLPRFNAPQNPIHETNKLLKKQQFYAEEMRPTMIRCAELIQTLTDTTLATQNLSNENAAQAENHARRSMRVAIGSIVIAIITSAISIYYAAASPSAEQIDKLAKTISDQTAALNAVARESQAAAALQSKEDREAFLLVLSHRQVGTDRTIAKSGAIKAKRAN